MGSEKKRKREEVGERFKEPIIIKRRKLYKEYEYSVENTKKRGWKETFDYVYKTQTKEEEQPESIQIDHIEYADDTSLINTAENEEVPKLKSYKKAAEEYGLEIQWKKTQILRKNIKMEDDGKAAGLPEPFQEVEQVKYGKILGLQICINTAQQEMIKERLQKAQNAWNIGQKYFLNTKTDKKYRIQLFNACIKPILQYGMITQNVTDVNIKKMQQKSPKMPRKLEEKEAWQKL